MAFPNVDVQSVDVYTNHPVLITKSLNGNEQRASVETQKWRITARFSNLSDADRRLLQSFIAEQQGALNTFDMALPGDLGNSSASFTGTITTASAGSVGDTSISITSDTSTAILKKGDLIRFTGENKTYTVTADATTDGSGNVDIDFLPGLVSAVSSSISVIHTDLSMNVRLDGEQFNYSVDPTQFSQFSLDMIEVF